MPSRAIEGRKLSAHLCPSRRRAAAFAALPIEARVKVRERRGADQRSDLGAALSATGISEMLSLSSSSSCIACFFMR